MFMLHEDSLPRSVALSVLGGEGRLSIMTGCKVMFTTNENVLMLNGIKKARNKCTDIIITYIPGDDLFKVEFMKYNPKEYRHGIISKHNDVYIDQLKQLIEQETGLYLSL